MRKILLLVLMTLALSGCSSKIDVEQYYQNIISTQDIEIEVEVLAFKNIRLEGQQRLVYVQYVEYTQDIVFDKKTIYAFCIYDKCDFISVNEYHMMLNK